MAITIYLLPLVWHEFAISITFTARTLFNPAPISVEFIHFNVPSYPGVDLQLINSITPTPSPTLSGRQ